MLTDMECLQILRELCLQIWNAYRNDACLCLQIWNDCRFYASYARRYEMLTDMKRLLMLSDARAIRMLDAIMMTITGMEDRNGSWLASQLGSAES